MSFLLPLVRDAKLFFAGASWAMPPDLWGLSAAVLGLLCVAAWVDAVKKIVPDPLIFLGLFSVAAVQGIFISWDAAALHLRHAVYAGVFIWSVNAAWFRVFRHDALGMGDAKWTMLAVSVFGIESAVVAWGISSVLATIFLGLFRLFNHRISVVAFSPFLFVGLCVALYIGPVW
ncbi:MAG: prepilin peptidase [Alphaproteobacteria bacterium]|nr:prepilin peptidase [Alphaproteobacteria bacterium]